MSPTGQWLCISWSSCHPFLPSWCASFCSWSTDACLNEETNWIISKPDFQVSKRAAKTIKSFAELEWLAKMIRQLPELPRCPKKTTDHHHQDHQHRRGVKNLLCQTWTSQQDTWSYRTWKITCEIKEDYNVSGRLFVDTKLSRMHVKRRFNLSALHSTELEHHCPSTTQELCSIILQTPKEWIT